MPPPEPLTHLVRPPVGEPTGLLVLFHGRGADERDLFPLLDLLDPERRMLGVTPRGPLHLPPGGAHWYAVHEIGYPDPPTFSTTFGRAATWLDGVVDDAGIAPEKVVIGGFSQGAVMSYALCLGTGRPRPAGLIALSGFMPTVPGYPLDLAQPLPRVAIGHGSARSGHLCRVESSSVLILFLAETGADVTYRESPNMAHAIDPAFFRELPVWLDETLATTE